MFCFCFGALPWIVELVKGLERITLATQWPTILIVLTWSMISWLFGVWLLFHALCRIEMYAFDKDVVVSRSLGWIQRDRRCTAIDSAYLVYRWRNQKSGPYLTFTIRCGRKNKTILSELEADGLGAVYEWLRESTSIKVLDLRDRPALN